MKIFKKLFEINNEKVTIQVKNVINCNPHFIRSADNGGKGSMGYKDV